MRPRLPGRDVEFQARGCRDPTPLRASRPDALRRTVSIISAATVTMTAKPYPGFLPLGRETRDAGGGGSPIAEPFRSAHSSNSEIDASVADSPARSRNFARGDVRAHMHTARPTHTRCTSVLRTVLIAAQSPLTDVKI